MKNKIVIIVLMSSISLINAMKNIKMPAFFKKINKEVHFKNNHELSHVLNPKTLALIEKKNTALAFMAKKDIALMQNDTNVKSIDIWRL